jgi:hypothetical protein
MKICQFKKGIQQQQQQQQKDQPQKAVTTYM